MKCVYSDISCSLALRFNDDSFKYLNSERELLSLLKVQIYNPYCFCVMRHVMVIALFFMVCLEIPFSGSLYCIETSQLSCVANQLTGFCGVRVFTKRCFRINSIFFWTKFFPLVIFCILTANFLGLICQDLLLLICGKLSLC